MDDLKILNCRIEYCGFGAVGGPEGTHGGWRNILIDRCNLSYSGHYYQGTPGPSPYDRPDGLGVEPSLGPMEIRYTVAQHNRGDGLDSKVANTYIHQCIVAHNSCDGIKLWGNGTKVENCLIYDTGDGSIQATPWAGLVIHSSFENVSFEIINTAVVDKPERRAYPMYVQYDETDIPIKLTMKNCIISHGQGLVYIGPSVNFTTDHNLFYRPGQEEVLQGGGSVFTASNLEAGAAGPGNLARDPLFVSQGSAEPEGYKLRRDSPAVDAGTIEGAPADDLEGNLRPIGGGIDMGPFEIVV